LGAKVRLRRRMTKKIKGKNDNSERVEHAANKKDNILF